MITVARIDERMIHGQVAYAWPVAYKSDAILAVDDEIAKDAFQKSLLEMAAPKVQYYDTVLMSESTYNTNNIAKEFGMSARTLNSILQSKGVQYRQGGQWLLYHKYQNRGFTKTHTYAFTRLDGSTGTSIQTVWTEAGRKFIHELLGA